MGGVQEQAAAQEDDDSVSSDDEDHDIKGPAQDVDSEGDESSDMEEVNQKGTDTFMAGALDIPTVNDIPIVSKLARQSEAQRMEEMDGEQKAKFIKEKRMQTVSKVVDDEEDALETHFVENPFIKLREKAMRQNANMVLGQKELEENAAEQDVYIVQESGKLVINDLEKKQRDKEERKEKRKKTGYGIDSDTDSDDDTAVVKKGQSSRDVKNEIKKFNASKRSAMSSGIHKQKSMTQIKKKVAGHIEKYSADAYKSAKGKGDVLKAGKHEPFSYI